MTMPFKKHTHHTAASKCVVNSKFSVTIPRDRLLVRDKSVLLSHENLVGVRSCFGVARDTEQGFTF